VLIVDTDAQAWCEVYLADAGWVAIDPALHRSEEPAPPDVTLAEQNYFSDKGRGAPPPDALMDGAESGSPLRHCAGVAVWLFLLVLLGPYLVKIWRRNVCRLVGDEKLYRVCYRASLDQLADAGLVRQPGETREEFALRIADWVPAFAIFTDYHLRSALDGVQPLRRHQWLHLQLQVTQHIAATVSLRRRVLGAIHPLSWLYVK
jgi:hypothetical protein